MLIYNVTTKVSWAIREAWVKWMLEKHIPEVMEKGGFSEYRFARLLETDETEGPTYTTQFYAANRDVYERYLAEHAAALRKDAQDNWGDQFIGFRSLMELVN